MDNTCLLNIDKSKNVLISLVKADNIDQYLDRSAKVYYTGKKFPSTVALNKLYYFMPYVKSKGIRDLYFIKIARIGTRKEGQPDEDKNDFRLVFEIDFVGQMFDYYKPIKLDIWRTFTDTTIEKLLVDDMLNAGIKSVKRDVGVLLYCKNELTSCTEK